jgi:hypothetical protein
MVIEIEIDSPPRFVRFGPGTIEGIILKLQSGVRAARKSMTPAAKDITARQLIIDILIANDRWIN